ncbi:MAG TPA: tetratricopeptide repeat protein [Candidatus Acidoferrum sp.]|nr:tetratricopeptide repeat protein [Candidatus Acidoferrum sp.]
MKLRWGKENSWAVWIALCAALFACAPKAAAQDGEVSGQILDVVGKPWADIGIQAVSDQGAKSDTKTDKDGNFAFHNLRNGVYTLAIQLPAPNKPYEVKIRVSGSDTPKVNLNFKDVVAKQGAEYAEQQKKRDEEQKKFQGMKSHFDAGIGFLNQANQAKADLSKAPADQRDGKKQEVKDLSEKAVTELEASKAAAGEKDSNLSLIWAKMGDAYDVAGRADDAVNAYKQAVELKPSADYYNNLGGILGRAGKIDEAMAAFHKSAELNPAGAAQAYRNAGITLYNVGKMKEAVEPLKKATELDPKNAQAWYLLGAALVASMEYKQVGSKLEVVVQPGTVEAYQKALELDPNGPYGQQAKEGLEALQQIAPGIDTKTKRKKS